MVRNRIAMVFEYPTLNGGERSMLQVLDLRDPQEFEFVALAPAHGRLADALRQRRVEHVPLELRDERQQRLPRQAACAQLVASIKQVAPALVHANSLAMGRLTGAVSRQLDVRSVAHLRDIVGLSRAAIDDLNQNQVLIAVSAATKRFHVEQGLDPERTRVIPNGVDCQRFRPRPTERRLRRELSLPETCFLILTIGQIGLRKGQDVLAAAAPAVVDRVPHAHFVIMGERNSSKPESVQHQRNVIAQFHRAGLDDRLHCVGYRSDVERCLGDADLLVHPAKQEPLGRVLLEAGAAGVPIVATAVGGTGEVLTEGVSARLTAPGDHRQLADAIVELALDGSKRRRFAAEARRRIVRDFNAQKAATGLFEVWREMLGA